MRMKKDYEHSMHKREVKEKSEYYFIEIASDIYFIEKNRFSSVELNIYVNSTYVTHKLNGEKRVAIESLHGLLINF